MNRISEILQIFCIAPRAQFEMHISFGIDPPGNYLADSCLAHNPLFQPSLTKNLSLITNIYLVVFPPYYQH